MPFKREFIGEALGTFLLVLFGCGSVAVTVLFSAHQGLMQVALAWGIGVTLAIYVTRHLSSAHLNPAVSVAMVVTGRLPKAKLPTYLIAQFLGAILGGLVLFLLFGPSIQSYELAHGIMRGSPASVQTAMIFGEFYPNPGTKALVSMPLAMGVESFGTFLLVLMIFGLTESSNSGRPDGTLAPVFIGATVSSIICLLAPLTQAGLNPARDLGPRLVTWMMGWGQAAFPDRTGGAFLVYVLAPVLGAILAGLFFVNVLEPAMEDIKQDPTLSVIDTQDGRFVMNSRLILVGGFLGAGKTTLLAEAARHLATTRQRVGLITNDQAPELVDTAFLSQGNSNVEEVSGSCFCCNFPGLLGAMNKLQTNAHADVLIAEPVGSCTDLSATIIQPLRDHHLGEVTVAPLSVLTDPFRLEDILNGGHGGLHPSAAYIFRKQMEEADILVISKADLVSPEKLNALKSQVTKELPLATVFCVSAKTGAGLQEWLDAVMLRTDAGQQIAEVDYDTYAEGEAVLGWLNATFELTGQAIEWHPFASDFLRSLSERLDAGDISVGHVKLMIEDGDRTVSGNITGRIETVSVRGQEFASSKAKMTLNARVEMSPAAVEQIVRETLDQVMGDRIQATTLAWRCLSPGRPMPTYRYDRLIAIK